VILDVEVDRLFVISDLHLGNPASMAAKRVLPFLDHVADEGASVCINGDGFDMLQTSFKRIASSAVPVLSRLRQISEKGGHVYYVVGNHDLVLEHFLDSILTFELSPFLNVVSGDVRIRIEHGHLYDPFFARYPDLYEIATHLAGLALFLHADVYRLWTWVADRADQRRRARAGDDLAATSYCHGAAEMLLGRGFDAVLFGHTHNAEHVQMPSGAYVNCGNWLRGHSYVEIDHGKIDLKSWDNN
jgi:UDP-2,3-diacylglucosamine pyrophosphatase LpxH